MIFLTLSIMNLSVVSLSLVLNKAIPLIEMFFYSPGSYTDRIVLVYTFV